MLGQSHGEDGDGDGQCHDDNQHGGVVIAAPCPYTHSTSVRSQVSMIYEKNRRKGQERPCGGLVIKTTTCLICFAQTANP